MKCPFCQKNQTRVIDSRLSPCQTQVKRRRECDSCKARFSTYECASIDWPKVVKRDGSKEPFDELKLKTGFILACDKLTISKDKIDFHLTEIKKKILTFADREIVTNKIGELVMQELRRLDPVAYVRFAAVYKRCHDLIEIDGLIRTLHENES